MKQTNPKKRGVGRILLILLIGVVFGFGVYTWLSSSVIGNQMPMPFGVGIGVVVTGSMEPELSIDDVIVVKSAPTYRVGDVVVYQQRNILVVHKIIAVDGTSVTTQGTANNVADAPIHVSAIKGRVWFHIDGAGRVVAWLRSPIGSLIVLAFAAWMLVKSYADENREAQAKREALEQIRREIEELKKKQ